MQVRSIEMSLVLTCSHGMASVNCTFLSVFNHDQLDIKPLKYLQKTDGRWRKTTFGQQVFLFTMDTYHCCSDLQDLSP